MPVEDLGGGIRAVISAEHTFGTDAFLLSDFSRPRTAEITCDLGTGCGIIPLLWFSRETAPKKAYAVDIQEQAVEQLRESVRLSGLGDKLTPLRADLRELKGVLDSGVFDLVTCNPPYKAEGTGCVSASGSGRIARHETLCTINDCCAAAARLLRFGGRFCLCQLSERLVDVFAAMRENRLEPKRVRFVQKDKNSAPWLVLVEGRFGSKPFLKSEPALFIYEDGVLSPEMREIYNLYKPDMY